MIHSITLLALRKYNAMQLIYVQESLKKKSELTILNCI